MSYNDAFKTLIDAIEKDLQYGKAFLMSSLLEMFKSYLQEDFSNISCRSDRLKSKVQKHYADLIVIQSQYGQSKSSIVSSSKIILEDAVKAAAKLKERLKDAQLDYSDFSMLETDITDHRRLIHSAVGGLRSEIAKIEGLDYYPNAAETSLGHSEKYVPSLLSSAMLWLTEQVKRRSLAFGWMRHIQQS